MKKVILVTLALSIVCGAAQAQQKPLAPCGPKAELADDYSNNVADDSRCFEIRMYTVNTERVGTDDWVGDIDMLHQRFREEEVAIFQKHGAEILGVFQSLDDPDTLVWMLAYRNRAHRQEVWKAFATDPAWKALFTAWTDDPFSEERLRAEEPAGVRRVSRRTRSSARCCAST